MAKRTIDHHASIVVVRAGDLFFFNGYDSGYPRKEWVGFLNPLGGNHELGDASPLSLLEREVKEEMSDEELKFPNFFYLTADLLKRTILSTVHSYQDFLIVDPVIEKTKNFTRDQRSAIVSVYEANVPEYQLQTANELLKAGKRLVSEGDGGSVVPLNALLAGKRFLAWSNPFMMSHYLGKQVPYSREGEAVPIGLPRKDFESYLSDFEYIKPVVK